MPKAVSRTAPKDVANNREAFSSATQLGHFGVRLAKFTHRVSADGAADFLSNYSLPARSAVLGVSIYVSEAYDGTTVTADIEAGGTSIITTPLSVASIASVSAASADLDNQSGELGINFSAVDSTVGECTVAVAYIDLSEL